MSKLEHGRAALSALELATLLRLYRVPEGSEQDRGRGPILWFTAAEWRAFTLGVRDGEFD